MRAQAISQIRELRSNVVLIDIDLCGESGLALTGSLGEGDGGAVVPHMILISTHDECEYADLIEASQAVGFFAKTELSGPPDARRGRWTPAVSYRNHTAGIPRPTGPAPTAPTHQTR